MTTVTHINPPGLHVNPAFTQAVKVGAGTDLVFVGGQNGVDSSGAVVADDLAGQTRQALSNLQECLAEAGSDIENVIKWTILVREGADLEEGFVAFLEVWGERENPPAISVAQVSGLAVPDALVEIEAIAFVPKEA
jgi:enamine deaminase RidA (YjgF/YER057c/UK114 family)